MGYKNDVRPQDTKSSTQSLERRPCCTSPCTSVSHASSHRSCYSYGCIWYAVCMHGPARVATLCFVLNASPVVVDTPCEALELNTEIRHGGNYTKRNHPIRPSFTKAETNSNTTHFNAVDHGRYQNNNCQAPQIHEQQKQDTNTL